MSQTIFFAHANGFPSATYAKLFDALAPDYRVRHLGQHGHDPRFPVDDNWNNLVDELILHLEQGDEPVWGVGHSLGGVLHYHAALRRPVNALERDEDPDGLWRRHCNDALARDYPALWARLDRLAWLHPPDFERIADWRWQQECAARAARPGHTGMSRAQVERFVRLFERVSRQAMRTLPGIADLHLRLDAQRRVRHIATSATASPRSPDPGC